ncbi:MAG TPA: hypothetical protein VJG90_04355 [Candidatus Nanoarchaeia archaeon]|nr:hypothetical protein [Candidatus Nanoarchaeia archaeon]
MIYRTREGIEYDLSVLNPEERYVLEGFKEAFLEVQSWISFHNRFALAVEGLSKKARSEKWQEHPLYIVWSDMIGAVGIRKGEMRGERRELSDLFINSKRTRT